MGRKCDEKSAFSSFGSPVLALNFHEPSRLPSHSPSPSPSLPSSMTICTRHSLRGVPFFTTCSTEMPES